MRFVQKHVEYTHIQRGKVMNKPEFNDSFAKCSRKQHKTFGGYVVDIFYGAKDAEGNPCTPHEDMEDGHGHWHGIDIDGQYQMFSWKHSAAEGGNMEYGTAYGDDAVAVMEEQLLKKKDLARQAELLIQEYEGEDAGEKLDEIKQQFAALHDWHTLKDAESAKRLTKAEAEFAPHFAEMQKNRKEKSALAKAAEKLRESINFKEARKELNALKEQMRALSSAGERTDHEMMNRLRAVEKELRQKQNSYFADLDARHAEAKGKKMEIIARTKQEVEKAVNFREASAKIEALFTEWKSAGSAGRDLDEELWKEYNEARQVFYDKRKDFFKKRDAAFKTSVEKKQALIEEAKKISASAVYSRENTERMKQLDKEWSAAGYSGKADNDRLWEEFNAAKEVFWDGKRDRAMARFKETVDAKVAEITKLSRSIDDLTYRIDITDQPHLKEEFRKQIAFARSKMEVLNEEVEALKERLKDKEDD